MKKCLVMLTKSYPFGKGEEFIEDEVPILAKAFDQVIIIATSVADGAQLTREVPENVTAHAVYASSIKKGLSTAALRLFPSRAFHGFVVPEELKYIKGSPKSRAFLAYFVAKSERVFAACRQILLPYHLETFDGVTFYAYWFYDVAVAATQLKKYCTSKSCRAVCRAHGYDLYPERSPVGYLPLRHYLLKNLDAVYPCSANGTQCIHQNWPGYTQKVFTAYLGTRDYGIGPVPHEDVFHIVSCCHICPLKRVDLLAEALAQLKDSGLKLKWTHIGGGDTLPELQRYASEHLTFMEVDFRGAMPNQELMQFYQKTPVNLFVNTSSTEGLPVSIMEAFSFGIPAIATDVGGTSELVRNGETGWLVPADCSAQLLAGHLRAAAACPAAEMQLLRSHCRKLWEKSFCGETNFTRFAKEIQPI